jgi:hypothetical protein
VYLQLLIELLTPWSALPMLPKTSDRKLSLLKSYIGETTTIIEKASKWHDDRRAVRTINIGD